MIFLFRLKYNFIFRNYDYLKNFMVQYFIFFRKRIFYLLILFNSFNCFLIVNKLKKHIIINLIIVFYKNYFYYIYHYYYYF